MRTITTSLLKTEGAMVYIQFLTLDGRYSRTKPLQKNTDDELISSLEPTTSLSQSRNSNVHYSHSNEGMSPSLSCHNLNLVASNSLPSLEWDYATTSWPPSYFDDIPLDRVVNLDDVLRYLWTLTRLTLLLISIYGS